MNLHDSKTLTVKFSKSMDLFNMRYSNNTVREHPTKIRSKAPGHNGVFFILKSSNFAKNKISPDEPHDSRTLTVQFSKSMDLFNMRYSQIQLENTVLKPGQMLLAITGCFHTKIK